MDKYRVVVDGEYDSKDEALSVGEELSRQLNGYAMVHLDNDDDSEMIAFYKNGVDLKK